MPGGHHRFRFGATVAVLVATAGTARADATGSVTPERWWVGWNADPVILLNIALASYLYLRGVQRLWRAGVGRGVTPWQAAAFGGGILALAAALVSPLDPLSDHLSAAHMVQHMVLMNLAAPLLVLGAPALVLLSGVPGPYRAPIGRWWQRVGGAGRFRGPALAWVGYAAVLWGWHVPAMYQAALCDPVVHDLEHLSFLAAACLFWRVVLDPTDRRRLNALGAVLFLLTTSLHAMALGVLMTLSPRAWYPGYEGRTEAWGLSALEDQQLAGLIMWMPACAVYAVVAAVLLAVWIGEQE